MVWLSSDAAGDQLLNLDTWDAEGRLTFAMRDNDWTVVGDIDDLEAPPSARSLIVRAPSKDIRISIEFNITSMERLRDQLRAREEEAGSHLVGRYEQELARLTEEGAPETLLETYRGMVDQARSASDSRTDEVIQSIENGWSSGDLVRCDFTAKIPFPYPIEITASKITLPQNNVISGAVAVDCGTAISLQ